MNLKINATKVFEKNYSLFQNDRYRYIINQGGSRSSAEPRQAGRAI